MPDEPMTKDEAGALSPPNGRGVSYALIEALTTLTTFITYFPPGLIKLSETELAEVILSATGQHLASSTRLTVQEENADDAYVVQLRHYGNVASMDALMTLISKTFDPRILPAPPMYLIPGERSRQDATGMGRQITRLIQGTIPLPEPRLIGELIAKADSDVGGGDAIQIHLDIGPDRHYSLGGPFSSVREYLQAYIKSSLVALEKQQDIEEYKEQYLERIRDFIDNRMDTNTIPLIVEDTHVVAIHSDMGPHNVMVSGHSPVDIQAVIDWEFVASAPFASQYRTIEMLFRRSAANGFGPEYEGAAELREAFWNAIPQWKTSWFDSESTQVLLEWFKFGRFLKPEWRPKDLPEDQARECWRENIRVIEGILQKYA
ncbi:hypothetical protein B0T26DRAFT_740137 [Lasiosphaeria miniovina]|uniref:Aminoglycoside phosphotransferase domain-containing protein n=1 Tax=Lasiosphaeria miniovina TaxID=1954250 RepID=A0AA40AWB4_9PEZI|nr:uncharacterized protein B0T26DRAFT_740137 [Lasiosphaeria miniovina]KAK0723098.1 hypothetical protein B0T26DRAFT_740137 [Lasiosphaeria miniovina]